MADPRKVVSNAGAFEQELTFLIDNSTITYSTSAVGGSASIGLAVTLSGNNTVALVADAQTVLGKLIFVNSDGTCTVRVKGVMTFAKGDSATVTAGEPIVGALGAASAKGYVRNSAAATLSDVANQRGVILTAATETAIEVLL